MSVKHHIPNAVTLLNLFSGCVATIFAVHGNFTATAIFVFLGIFFDFFDGLLARKLQVQSPLGLQLDSLADVVTSGVVPGIVMFKLIELSQSDWQNIDFFNNLSFNNGLSELNLLPFLGLLIPLASAYRLAKFNLDTEQQNYFKGLPTPANALFILSFALILEFQDNDIINSIIVNPWFLILLTLISCFLLNAPIKLFALKFKSFTFKDNTIRYTFLALCIVALIVLQFAAIPVIILLYILMSLVKVE